MSNAMITNGGVLSYSSNDSSYTDLVEVTSVSFDVKIDSIDVTSIGSSSATREFIAGLIDPGTMKFDLHYYENQISTIYPILTGRTIYYFRLTLPDASYFKAQAFPTSFSIEGTGPDNVVMAKSELKLTTKPAFTLA